MRKIFLVFSAISIAATGASFAACSSSSGDDSGVTPDSGSDTSIATDTGTPDTGPGVDAGPCSYCGDLVSGKGSLTNACTGSVNLAIAVIGCACNTTPTGTAGEGLCDTSDAGDAGVGACADLCAAETSGTPPTNACLGCAADNCAPELGACQADGTGVTFDAGTDAGPDGG